MSERIRVDEATYAALEALEDDEERFDELFSRLLREREVVVDAGAEIWEGTDAVERARETRVDNRGDVGAPRHCRGGRSLRFLVDPSSGDTAASAVSTRHRHQVSVH